MATKTTFRHIGYYSDYEDITKLFGRSADFIVNAYRDALGSFHRTAGGCDTDIDDYNDEHDANAFQLTTDKLYLVRFERGANDGEGWYIDIYKLTEIEVDDDDDQDTNDEDDNDEDDTVEEYCPYCENEVYLKNEFKVQTCPDCGHAIVPCSICPLDECRSVCPLDALCRQKNEELEESEGIIETTLSLFLELLDNQESSHQAQGYTIFIPETSNTIGHKLIFRYVDNIYVLYNPKESGQSYVWTEFPKPNEFFVGLWNVSGEELDCIKVKPNF